jgi:CRISPR-associated protein (TIGR02584 family)
MHDASTFPRRILLCTVGLTPQIVTEALYALCVAEDEPFIPTEIHVITTADGEERTRAMLLEPPQEQLAKFAAEFGIPVTGALRSVSVQRHLES